MSVMQNRAMKAGWCAKVVTLNAIAHTSQSIWRIISGTSMFSKLDVTNALEKKHVQWTCKICQGVASATVSFTEFRKTANSRKHPRLACCDKCWHLWARCINCKTMWPKDEFNIWMDEMPSRRRTGKTKWMRCNTCMRENRDAATLQSRHDVSEVMKKRRKDT